MKVFLAVDGGQTSTKVVLADDGGRILAHATGGPSNHTEEPGGADRLRHVIRDTVGRALRTAGLQQLGRQEMAAACFGMTGETAIKRQVLEGIIRTPRLAVVHDSVNALVGATAGKPGIIVIAGTGSVARGANSEGREARVGGWGHLFGDEGSAFWIGREAVRAIAGTFEGFRARTQLAPMFVERLGVSSAYELMERYYSGAWSRDHLAGLAVWVNEAASAGDLVALQILQEAGKELARLALAVLSLSFEANIKSDAGTSSPGRPIVSYSGGVFENQFVLSAFKESLHTMRPGLRIEPPLLPPVLGSLLLAYRNAKIEPSESTRSGWIQAWAGKQAGR